MPKHACAHKREGEMDEKWERERKMEVDAGEGREREREREAARKERGEIIL